MKRFFFLHCVIRPLIKICALVLCVICRFCNYNTETGFPCWDQLRTYRTTWSTLNNNTITHVKYSLLNKYCLLHVNRWKITFRLQSSEPAEEPATDRGQLWKYRPLYKGHTDTLYFYCSIKSLSIKHNQLRCTHKTHHYELP